MSPSSLPELSDSVILFQGTPEGYEVTIGDAQPLLNPYLFLERCRDYTFIIDATGYQLVIKTQPGIGLDDLLVIENNNHDFVAASTDFPTLHSRGIEQGSFTFRIRHVASIPSLFYQSTSHEGMGSELFHCRRKLQSPQHKQSNGNRCSRHASFNRFRRTPQASLWNLFCNDPLRCIASAGVCMNRASLLTTHSRFHVIGASKC